MKSLLILYGESFRLGGQGTRNRGSEKSYKPQIDAALTHVKFIQNLKKKYNLNMLVSINSYTTKYDNHLTQIYKNVLINAEFYENLLGVSTLIHNCIHRINNIDEYNFILCMRIDLFLKDKFIEIFNPNSNKILFPSVCFEPYHKCGCGLHPKVNDMMIFIPKNYFKLIKNITPFSIVYTNTWCDLITKHNFKLEDLDMMLNTYHDGDSAKDFNPIYYIVNRPQKSVNYLIMKNKIFDKYNFK